MSCQLPSCQKDVLRALRQRATRVHTADHIVPCSPVPPITLHGLLLVSLARSVGVRTLGAEELARDVEGLASHNNDLLAVEELLGDGAGEATEQVALAVDDLRALSAGRPMVMCGVDGGIVGWHRGGMRRPVPGISDCVYRGVRTMTGSNVDILLDSGVL
jgi:hypothetical protein